MPIYTPSKGKALVSMPPKDPDAVNKPYTVLCLGNMPGDTTGTPATFLPVGVSIVSAIVTPSDPAVVVVATTVAAGYVTMWLSGGTVNTVVTVTTHIVTDLSNGIGGFYEDDVSFLLPIKQR